MPVPSSGSVSFSVIAQNLSPEPPTPYSLNDMANSAGFSSPHSVSEFYGYSPGGGLTLFYRSPQETGEPWEACYIQCDIPQYHNGANPLPTVGDMVYNDPGGNDPIQSSGNYWGMSEIEFGGAVSTFLTFKRGGSVVDVYLCGFE